MLLTGTSEIICETEAKCLFRNCLIFSRFSSTFCPHTTYPVSLCRVWGPDIRHWPASGRSVSCSSACHLKAPLQLRGPRVWLGVRWRLRGNASRWHQHCRLPQLCESHPQVRMQHSQGPRLHSYLCQSSSVWQDLSPLFQVLHLDEWLCPLWERDLPVLQSLERSQELRRPRGEWTELTRSRHTHLPSFRSQISHITQKHSYYCLISDWSTSRQNQKSPGSTRPSEEDQTRRVRLWKEEVCFPSVPPQKYLNLIWFPFRIQLTFNLSRPHAKLFWTQIKRFLAGH